MASLKDKNPEFVISIAFGKSDKLTRNPDSFKRKGLDEISDIEDERLIPAQLAPSAINSQPWFFKHSSDDLDVYQVKQNILKRQVLKKWNPIDVGIALAIFMYPIRFLSYFSKKVIMKKLKVILIPEV